MALTNDIAEQFLDSILSLNKISNEVIEKYQPKIFAHGHVHMNYGRQFPREDAEKRRLAAAVVT